MDKNIIKNHLTKRFMSEVNSQSNTPGITMTNAIQKKSGEENKAGLKAIAKDLTAYSKDVKKDKDMSKIVQNKFNYEDGELEYHNQMEIMNGQEMIEYDREPNKMFKDRAKEAIEGSSRMGNKGGKDMGNAEAMDGVSSDDFGKERIKNAVASTKKRQDAVKGIVSFGDDIETVPKNYAPMSKHSALSENLMGLTFEKGNLANTTNINEVSNENISNKLKENLTNLVNKLGANETAVKLVNKLSQTGMFENNYNNKLQIKETMKRLKFNKNGDKPFEGVNITQKLGHALTLIPESYKVDSKEFEMTDGSVSCKVRWEGTLNEGKAVVLLASDKSMVNEDMQKMKHLMNYKSQETLGTVKGMARLNENVVFGDIWNKTKILLEGEDIESAKVKTGNFDDVKKKAPEATKHVEGSVPTDKKTKTPSVKEGDLEDIEKKAPEATKHVTMKESMYEGDEEESEEGEEEGVVKEVSSSNNIEGTKKANGHWEDISVPHAAEAKKHVHMGKESAAKVESIGEGIELNGTIFNFINENYMEEDDEEDYGTNMVTGKKLPKPDPITEVDNEEVDNEEVEDEEVDVDVDAEPSDDEIDLNIPSVDGEDEEDEVKVPSAPVAKAGPRLMVSQSTGEYFIVGAGPKPVPVPLEDKEIAKRNPAKYLESLMGDEDSSF